MRCSQPRSRGFTLLEVLAAVAILAIAYATLGASGIQGLQHEGEARRRLEASLLADSAMGQIERGIEQGVVPAIGREERQLEDHLLLVEVAAFALELPEPDTAPGSRIGRRRSRLGGESGPAPAPVAGPSLLVGGRGPGAEAPLRRIDVRVRWTEGWGEREVVRTTFALDREAAQETLEALSAAATQGGSQPANPLGGQPAADEEPAVDRGPNPRILR